MLNAVPVVAERRGEATRESRRAHSQSTEPSRLIRAADRIADERIILDHAASVPPGRSRIPRGATGGGAGSHPRMVPPAVPYPDPLTCALA
jgi:hypothetical protein